MKGEPVLRNLKCFFEQLYDKGHELVNHNWTPREEFLKICASMDVGMQCNFSETFNIVGADLVSQGVPFVSSKEVPWSSEIFNANPSYSEEICSKLLKAYKYGKINVFLNKMNLKGYTTLSKNIWIEYFKD